MTAENVASGFLATGICPYNPGAIPDKAYAPAELYSAEPVNALDTAPLNTAPAFDIPLEIEPLVSSAPVSPTTLGTVSATVDSNSSAVLPLSTPIVSSNEAVEAPYVINTSQLLGDHDSTITTDTSLLTTSLQGEEIIVSLDIHGDSGTVDLPLVLTEDAMLELLQDQLPDFSGAATSTGESHTTSCLQSESVSEYTADMALSVIESAITEEKKQSYEHAFMSGKVLNDSMYTTWCMYKGKQYKSTTVETSPPPNNPLLTIPKQQFSNKPSSKKKAQYFVISSDEAFNQQVKSKLEKERKAAEAEERKRQRQSKKEQKEKALAIKQEKKRVKCETVILNTV